MDPAKPQQGLPGAGPGPNQEKKLVTDVKTPTASSAATSQPGGINDGEMPEKYKKFCYEVGILNKDGSKKTKLDSWSFYSRIVRAEKLKRWEYASLTVAGHLLLFVQIMIGAVITALGASKSPHIVIAVFGAINTVIGALITFFKYRGEPIRARQTHNDLRNCLEQIQDVEAQFLDPDCKDDVAAQIAMLRKLYYTARKNEEANYPDLWSTQDKSNDDNKDKKPTSKTKPDAAAEADKGHPQSPN